MKTIQLYKSLVPNIGFMTFSFLMNVNRKYVHAAPLKEFLGGGFNNFLGGGFNIF